MHHYALYAVICQHYDCYYFGLSLLLPLVFLLLLSWCIIMHYMSPHVNIMIVIFWSLPLLLIIFYGRYYDVPLCIICHHMSISWLLPLKVTIAIIIDICFLLLWLWCTITCYMSLHVDTVIVVLANHHSYYLFINTMMYDYALHVIMWKYYACNHFRLPLLLFVLYAFYYDVPWCIIWHHTSAFWLFFTQATVIIISIVVCSALTLLWCIIMHHMPLYVGIVIAIIIPCHCYCHLFRITIAMMYHYALYDIICQHYGC